MSWGVKPPSVAEDATIELRRIIDVLQVEHASLFLRDPEHPQRAVHVAETGAPLDEALAEHATVIGRVLSTGRVQEVEPREGTREPIGSALATPLEHDGETVGALLVVSLRRNRRLGATDAQVIGRATETLVELTSRRGRSERFTRDAKASAMRDRR